MYSGQGTRSGLVAQQEMMNDTIDDAMAEDNDEAEESEIINKVLEEIGIGMNQEVRYLQRSPCLARRGGRGCRRERGRGRQAGRRAERNRRGCSERPCACF